MSDLFGFTRSIVKHNYALFTPDGLVKSPLQGWHDYECYVVISPSLGARFVQLLINLGGEGRGSSPASPQEMVVFVLEGAIQLTAGTESSQLTTGGFAYLPPQQAYTLQSQQAHTRLLAFQRTYTPLEGHDVPGFLAGNESEIEGVPFLGDEAALLKTLLPDIPAFDMAVNIFTFAPGATLPMVETHIMEHGMLMIQGQGIYRLGDDWHPIQAGDAVWMGSYCPQWFVATGKTPARYIYYKDVNRDPLTSQ